MKVQNETLAMASQRLAEERLTRTETLEITIDQTPAFQEDRLTISKEGKDLCTAGETDSRALCENDLVEGDSRLLVIRGLVEALTGRTIHTIRASDLTAEQQPEHLPIESPQEGAAQPERVGWGVRYDFHEEYAEEETTTFEAEGMVTTSDGREISFSVNLTMSRAFVRRTDLTLRAGDAALSDPLVINFSGTAAQLTDQEFTFDLDADGKKESIPMLDGGSGFLVFDRNRDRVVNDGSELFGPATGDGFKELSQFDENRDGWIDENDAVYKDLFVWTRDQEGNDQLSNLKEGDVGAIASASAHTPFALKDSANRLKGQVVKTGVYLTESGKARTIQQLLLKV